VEVNTWLAEGDDEACWTDEKGFWSLDNVPPENVSELPLWLTHPDFVSDLNWRGANRSGSAEYTIAELRAQTARVAMKRGVKVSGTLKDPEGKPVDKAMIVWGHLPYHNPRHQETFTDKEGVFHLPPLAMESTPLTVVAEGFAPQLQWLAPGGLFVNMEIHLERGQTTTFKFVDGDGKPIPKVQVNVAKWRGEKTLFNWRHPNVPYSLIPDQANDQGVWQWTWAPDDAVQYYFFKTGFKETESKPFGPGEHEVVMKRK
jgi:hypothetical protein